MRMFARLALLAALTGGAAAAHDVVHTVDTPHANVTELMTRALKDYPGKEITTIVVDYPPGAVDPVHRHDAHAIVYVLEGTIVMGVRGQPEQTLKPGDTFYEGPDDVHTVGHNASQSLPAKFLVFILKDKKNPIVMPAK